MYSPFSVRSAASQTRRRRCCSPNAKRIESLQLNLDLPLLALIGENSHEQILVLGPDFTNGFLERLERGRLSLGTIRDLDQVQAEDRLHHVADVADVHCIGGLGEFGDDDELVGKLTDVAPL